MYFSYLNYRQVQFKGCLLLVMFLHSLMCMSAGCQFMKCPPEMKYPPKSVTFCSRVIAFSGCEKELNVHALVEKLFWKFQQISAIAMESISRKCPFQKLGNVLWKRALPHLFFYMAIYISLTSPWKYLFFLPVFSFTTIHESKDCRGRARAFV